MLSTDWSCWGFFTARYLQCMYSTALSWGVAFLYIMLFHWWEVFNKTPLRLNRSERLVRLTAASTVTVITVFYELPITLTKEMWQPANSGCVRHRRESSLCLLIDWEENSLNSVFHLSQSKSKLSSPPVGGGMTDATLDSLLLLNTRPIAWHERTAGHPSDNQAPAKLSVIDTVKSYVHHKTIYSILDFHRQ